jgi:hypothetical protein
MSEETSTNPRVLTDDEINECRANVARTIRLNPSWPIPNALHLIGTIDARDKTIAEQDAEISVLRRELEEVRQIVEAKEGEGAADALRRGIKELFDTAKQAMAEVSAASIDESMRVGAKGMRDACAQIAGALSTSANPMVAETSRGIRKAIEALPLPEAHASATSPAPVEPPLPSRAPQAYVTSDGIVRLPAHAIERLGVSKGGGVFVDAEPRGVRILSNDNYLDELFGETGQTTQKRTGACNWTFAGPCPLCGEHAQAASSDHSTLTK